jgi:hypothetical protein
VYAKFVSTSNAIVPDVTIRIEEVEDVKYLSPE